MSISCVLTCGRCVLIHCRLPIYIIVYTQRECLTLRLHRRILGPVYDNEKENWRILTSKEIHARVKKTYYNRDNRVK